MPSTDQPFSPFKKPGLHHIDLAVQSVECWRAMSENMRRRHCQIGRVRIKARRPQRDLSDLARQPGVQIETIWR